MCIACFGNYMDHFFPKKKLILKKIEVGPLRLDESTIYQETVSLLQRAKLLAMQLMRNCFCLVLCFAVLFSLFFCGQDCYFGVNVSEELQSCIDLYHTMLKQKILPVQPLIQCEAGRAKTKLFVPLGLKMAAA